MNLYLLSQDENSHYDTYDSCVVVAADEESARLINPHGDQWNSNPQSSRYGDDWRRGEVARYSSWASRPENVTVKLIGIAALDMEPGDVVCASFNAG